MGNPSFMDTSPHCPPPPTNVQSAGCNCSFGIVHTRGGNAPNAQTPQAPQSLASRNGPGQRGADESSMRRDSELLIKCQEHPKWGREEKMGERLETDCTCGEPRAPQWICLVWKYLRSTCWDNSSDARDEHHGGDSSFKPCPKQAVRLPA